MIYGYARVSSADQNLDRQLKALGDAGVDASRVFSDKCSGKNLKRPSFQRLDKTVKEGDVVVVASMDRLARSLNDLLEKVNDFGNRGVTIKFLKENIEITSGNISPISRLLLGIMGAVAEFERNLIRERQREGIELAKKRGVYKGRTPVQLEKIAQVMQLIEEGISVVSACRQVGIARTTFYTKREELLGEGNSAAAN